MTKRISVLFCAFLLTATLKAQVSGYLQTQYQYGEESASLKVGSPNENPDESFNRIGIRRGRIKFIHEEKGITGVVQVDFTEKGLGIKDAYFNIKRKEFDFVQLKAGIFDRPFGNEISYSSSRRESPERSLIFQTLFPDERDLGGMLVLQAPKTSPWSAFKLEAGLFAGNAISMEADSKKDFISHLSFTKTFTKTITLGLGISYYNGGVYQGVENVYTMKGKEFVLNSDSSNRGQFAKREYLGCDVQFSVANPFGKTQLRAEYLFGQQPGTSSSSKSPNTSVLPTVDTYIRDFSGGYAILVQDIGTSPFSAVLKYDWYDPNTQISENEVLAKADLFYNTLGMGALWRIQSNLILQAYYEINRNEKTSSINAAEDIKDNVFTLRVQYKF